jgi:ribonucleoside-diphosphate reductase beta chain
MKRRTLYPILSEDLFEFYKTAIAARWIVEEVDLSNDKFDELTQEQQNYLKNILAFFASSDIIVNENIVTKLITEVPEVEAQFYYCEQLSIEAVHSEMYSLFIEEYIKDSDERDKLFNGIEELPAVKKKAEWALKWLESDSFEERMLAFSCVEMLSFAGVFAGIFFFRTINKMPGLCSGNNFIFLDENSHGDFAVHYYNNYCKNKLSSERLREIVLECLETEKQFTEDIMPNGISGLQKEPMLKYLESVADEILVKYGTYKEFGTKNPLNYMEQLKMDRRVNRFEARSNQYVKLKKTGEIDFNVEF